MRRGTPVGYVGFTGNANPAGPHLHFAINRMAPGEKWYQGTPINPYPLLAGKPQGARARDLFRRGPSTGCAALSQRSSIAGDHP